MKKFIDNLKRQAEENPIVALMAVAAVFTATSKLMDANTARSAAKTHAMEIQRRMMLATTK